MLINIPLEVEHYFLPVINAIHILNIYPLATNGLSHPYQLDESIFNFRGVRSVFVFIFISFFDANHVSKQNSSRLDAASCGVASGAILFAPVPKKGRQAYKG